MAARQRKSTPPSGARNDSASRAVVDEATKKLRSEMRRGKIYVGRCGLAAFIGAAAAAYLQFVDGDSVAADFLMRAGSGLFLISAGFGHFVVKPFFMEICPRWLPLHWPVVALSGVAEILCGLLALCHGYPALQNLGAWGSIALYLAVYPVNMSMLVDVELRRKLRMTMAQAVLRMPLQFLFIWLAYMQTSKSFADTATGLLARG